MLRLMPMELVAAPVQVDNEFNVAWMTPQSTAQQLHVLSAFTLVLAGIAVWEFISNLPFDIRIFTGRRRFQWPMVLYVVCRLSMVIHVFMFAININTSSEIPCQSVVMVSNVTDMLGTVTSSAILALRSHAVWGNDRRIGAFLLTMLLIQTGLWSATFYFTNSVWDPTANFCRIVTSTPGKLLLAVFTYTMSFDFIILSLAAYSLWPQQSYGGISALLLHDGIGYFTVAFLSNTLQTVLVALKLSPVMNLMCVPFALVASCIAATTVYRRTLKTPDRLAKRREESFRRAGLTTGASLPQFAPPPSKASGGRLGEESTFELGSRFDMESRFETELGSNATRTMPLTPLKEWELEEGSSEMHMSVSDKQPVDGSCEGLVPVAHRGVKAS